MSKAIIIDSAKCPKCGTELPIGVHELHGLPHTYYLPCPKCGFDPQRDYDPPFMISTKR